MPYYLIGTDEAGYGPNLGPLVIASTLWRVEEDALCPNELYEALAPVVAPDARVGEIFLADSKKVHKKGTFRPLEEGLFPALYAADARDENYNFPNEEALYRRLAGASLDLQTLAPWERFSSDTLPIDADAQHCRRLGARLREKMLSVGVVLCDIEASVVFPPLFNHETFRLGSKGAFLSTLTLDLVAKLVSKLESKPPDKSGAKIVAVCDKHGGRNFYLPILMESFPGAPFFATTEGREKSEYVQCTSHREFSISFQTKGEAYLPAALASMTCKYLRELSMSHFNAWWRARVPNLAPTAGYPLDAKRFLRDAAEFIQRENLDTEQFWRAR
ncbi:MAG: hypothetical protein Q4D38_03205 [Planctomycetia bacterium]|nr:hypothetical protein [Planctomycetia bacterium]